MRKMRRQRQALLQRLTPEERAMVVMALRAMAYQYEIMEEVCLELWLEDGGAYQRSRQRMEALAHLFTDHPVTIRLDTRGA